MKRQPDAKWLREMSREVADEPVPEIDWPTVEQRVFDRLEEPGRPLRIQAPAPVWPRVAAIAAIAAGIALAVTWSTSDTHPPENAPTVAAATAETPHEGVTAGTMLAANAELITVEHQGWARFQLAPHSQLRVQRLDDHVALNLMEGRVDAQVTKRGGEEIFTVQVDGMRVAVRGTIFSVERRGDELHVQVQRGVVAVGRSAPGAAEPWLVQAPSTGTFSLQRQTRIASHDGVESKLAFAPEATAPIEPVDLPGTEGPEPPRAVVSNHHPSHPAPTAGETLPENLTSSLAASTLSRIASQVEACYRNAVPRNEGVTVHAHTSVNIQVAPDGHVVFARFDPPLAPAAQSCASRAVQSATFPRARTESLLVLPLDL